MLYLMRHGQDDERYIGGWSDVALTLEGEEDVKKVALWLKKNILVKKIICSDIKRAIQTAHIVNHYYNVDLVFDKQLREQSKGIYNGKLKESLSLEDKKFIENVNVKTIFPQGESLKDLYLRVKSYLNLLLKMDDDILLVTHRGVINMIYYILNGIELDMNKGQFDVVPASVHELDQVNKKIRRIK